MATTTASIETITLTLADRCDVGGCPAASFVRIQFESGLTLDFCQHHARKNASAIPDTAVAIGHPGPQED